ncbi:ATP-binding protein [Runella slithyformis]|uniref:AAA ATPase n=1 Tax=Runella slithyformis (strain ATCC 29530 / DSM 19594 / LMG 11500 / NCIMB 11436 / LSU 4) TaxID=761193 RepID=A0A7U4E794_RUNSL|nr:ATP-binding protein [Runella slithyformis]AEI50418.1 AAA ATPase [Runella slithyformis DSM 19594]
MDFKRFISNRVLERIENLPAVALLGPRQVGKTTLAKQLQKEIDKDSIYLDLESQEDVNKLTNLESYLLQREDKLIIIDEVQRMPELFPVLRSVIDRNRSNTRFMLLGSASPELLAKSSETLAGRISYIEVHPFVYTEIAADYTFHKLWLRGGFPTMLMAKNEEISFENRIDFIQTYLERELPLLGLSVSPGMLRNLLRMIAHAHGQILNYSDLSKSLGIDVNTVKRYLDYFENSFLIRRLQPYYVNIAKRLVKSPKIYIRDSGLLHAVVAIENEEDLEGYIGKGNSWEGFVIQQIIALSKPNVHPYFYRTQDGSELDLVLVKGTRPVLGIEIKYADAPKITKGTTVASQDMGNIPVLVVTPFAREDYELSQWVTVTNFERLFSHLGQLKLINTN